jgi:hypothetical protein
VASPTLSITVTPASVQTGQPFTVTYTAADPDVGATLGTGSGVTDEGTPFTFTEVSTDAVTADPPTAPGVTFTKTSTGTWTGTADTAGKVTISGSVSDSGKHVATATATVTVTAPPPPPPPPPPTVAYPKVASVQQNSGEPWADAVVRNLSYGFNGAVRYLPGGTLPAWDATFQALAAKAGTQPLNIQLTAKTHDDAGLRAVLSNLPAAWKPGFIYNIYQEPEDNLSDAASQAAYRGWYTAAAKVTRAFSWAKLPWVEWHEYAGNWDLTNFTPPAADFGGVLWSLFEYGEKDRLDTQVPHITSMMARYAPGKPWALMAGAYTLEPVGGPFTQAQLDAQAAWMKKHFTLTKAAGSQGWAWYNVSFSGTGGAAGEARVEKNPGTLSTLKGFPAA